MLVLVAQTAPSASAQTQSDAAIATWGLTGSAPQTGSSTYTSGKAFKTPSAEQGAPASESQAKPLTRSTPAGQRVKAAKLPASKILVVIDKPTQEMKVFVDDVERYSWKVSTGIRRYDTPSGRYTARSMNEIWYSKQWDDAPMPHAIFFTGKGHAIHGTEETKRLGRPASHGCVRLAPENATTLFALVKETGLDKTDRAEWRYPEERAEGGRSRVAQAADQAEQEDRRNRTEQEKAERQEQSCAFRTEETGGNDQAANCDRAAGPDQAFR
jgi:lipoprotein-anchoring transpeptidase ErfK/SrfK